MEFRLQFPPAGGPWPVPVALDGETLSRRSAQPPPLLGRPEMERDLRSEMSAGVLKSDVEMMWNATTSAQENANMAPAVAAMNVLADWIKKSKATTMMELQIQLKTAAEHIESFAPDVIAITAGCELFIRYVTRSNSEIPNFQECRAALVDRSAYYKEMTLKSRNRIAELGETFIRDGSVVLLHGNSRVVLRVLQAAGESGKRFSVIVTEGQPDGTLCVRVLAALVAVCLQDRTRRCSRCTRLTTRVRYSYIVQGMAWWQQKR